MTYSPCQTRPLMWIDTTSTWWTVSWDFVLLGQYRAALVGTWYYWVSIGWYWWYLVALHLCKSQLVGTGSVDGGTGWYFVKTGGTGCQYDMLSEIIRFAWSKSSNYWIVEEWKVITDKQTNKQTDRISFPRLDPFCWRGRVKKINGTRDPLHPLMTKVIRNNHFF